jgi:tRNA threonylcarbamoyladenosine biosynthesis protein TsaB
LKLLALDTSTEACSAALWLDGETLERFALGREHAGRILPMVEELLAEAGLGLSALDAIAFGRGPGSFTGLRITAGIVQGLAFGADLPVVPVSTLAALAQGTDSARVLAALDARMHQVYWGAYRRNAEGLMESAGEECVIAPEQAPLPPGTGWIGAGSGWDRYAEALQQRLGSPLAGWRGECYPHARDVAALGAAAFRAGQAVSAERAIPVYLRDEVAVKSKPPHTG